MLNKGGYRGGGEVKLGWFLLIAMTASGSAFAADLLPDAQVRTSKQAIAIATRTATIRLKRPDLWHAQRHELSWDVWMERDDVPCARAEQMQINAMDGKVSEHVIVVLPLHGSPSCENSN
jgi:hypothetical protein